MAGSINNYDRDEVLIISGKIADQVIGEIKTEMDELFEAARNRTADQIEELITSWDGACTIPLPDELRQRCLRMAFTVAVGQLNFLLTEAFAG